MDIKGKLAEINSRAEEGREKAIKELIDAVGNVQPRMHVNARKMEAS